MPIRNKPDQWGVVSIGLHWLTFLMILGLATVGLLMTDLPTGSFKVQVYALHKSFGLTVLALTLLRLVWRLLASAPEAVAGTPRWQDRIAKLTHGAMYVLLLLIPLSGWLFNSAAGFPLRWFNLFKVPKLGAGYDPDIKAFAHEAHELLFYALALLLVAHAAAALFHHYRLHDRTLMRMLPFLKPAAVAPVAPPPSEES
ncbi:cytochrome b [Arenimonas oryziterrae]|uniref:Cytochrome b561 bacterial/Ni-hydrogenase domain-containing protein n=1 Tax=Arenimonas oryziterrae DSM 21050 = YC6267 TaxID=1121015 RepID=A0A091AW17_9GAMM|nr:cytochrome b [Arenimonas oryziterrae]KFN43447.1 hypothetical protein N789_09230 [Arenimonas oryziterrae DSM 21050 = YC6267]